MNFQYIIVLLVGLSFSSATASPVNYSVVEFKKSTIEIASRGKLHKFKVELALSPHQQSQGLMFRRLLPADAGMLFIYQRIGDITMWMKNTFLPLDMIFIRSDRRIHRIAERTIPLSEKRIFSGGPVMAVLELNAGTVERLGIKVGDRIKGPAFGPH